MIEHKPKGPAHMIISSAMLLMCALCISACGGGDPEAETDQQVPTPVACQAQQRPPACL